MTDPPLPPDPVDEGTPLWVKVFGIVLIIVTIVIFFLMYAKGGMHGLGRHL